MDRSSGRAVTSGVAVSLAALVAVSAGVEATRPYAGSQAWLVPLVGVVLAGSAALVRAPALPRLLLAVTSGAWLLGSLSPWLLLAHQGALLLVLLAVPTGRIDGVARWVGVLSVPIALGMLAQPVVGVILSSSGRELSDVAERPTGSGSPPLGCSWVGRCSGPGRSPGPRAASILTWPSWSTRPRWSPPPRLSCSVAGRPGTGSAI